MRGRLQQIRAKLLTREFRNTLLYVVSSAFGAALGIVTLPLFSRYLSPTEFGTVGYVMSINAFLGPVFLLSLNSYYIRRYYTETDPESQATLLSSLLYFTVGWSVLVTAVLGVSGALLFRLAGVQVPFFPFMLLMLLSNLALGPFTYATLQYRMRHQALGYAVLTILQAALMAGIGLVLVGQFQRGAVGRVEGLLYGMLATGVVSCWALRPFLRWRFRTDMLREGIRFALPLIPVAIITLLFDTVDRIFIERLDSLASLGYYNVANQYASALQILSLSIYRAYEPGYFEMAARHDFARMNRSFVLVSGLFFASTLLLMVLGGPVINLLTHGRFAPSVGLANILLMSFFLKSVYILSNVLLTTVGRTKAMMWSSLLGLVCLIAASSVLIPAYGAAGAAYAKVVPMLPLIVLAIAQSGHFRQFRSTLLANAAFLLVLAGVSTVISPFTAVVLRLLGVAYHE